jgi:hypothetical protein
MATVKSRGAKLEESLREGGRDGREEGGRQRRSLVHMKMITPTVLAQPENWKKWKGDLEEYCEDTFPGFKEKMENVKKAEEEVDDEWFLHLDDCWWQRADQLWRLLRRFTEGEARRRSERGRRQSMGGMAKATPAIRAECSHAGSPGHVPIHGHG